MSLTRSYNVPSTLPILPLPPGQVLYPSLVLSIQLASASSVALLRSVLRESEQSTGNKPIIIGCAPLKSDPPASGQAGSNAGAEAGSTAQSSDDQDKKNSSLKIIQLPADSTRNDQLNNGKTSPDALFPYGVAARLVRIERMSNGGYACVLEGLSRIALHMDEFSPPSLPFHETRVDILKTTPLPQSSPLLGQLQTTATSALATLGAASALSPLLTRRLRGMLANLSPESAPALVDAMMGSIALTTPTTTNGLTLEDKLAVLAAVNGEERVKLGIEILSRCDETIALKKRIEGKVGDAMTRRQREFLLMQQLQAIRQELEELSKQEGSGIKIVGGNGRKSGPGANGPPSAGDDEEEEGEVDDMAELEKAIKAKKWTPEARKVVSREFKRLKKSPPQGAEHGVIRNYLDTLLALPWAESTATPLSRDFISAARQKLNDDHYGLDKVKKRLLEWLAVLRLKNEQWEAEEAAEQAIAAAESSKAGVKDAHTGTEEASSPPAPSTELVLHESSGGPPAAPSSPPVAPTPPTPLRTKPRDKGPILLLCGPPGTGKTSIARSLADAMGRKFYRISLGGVRDEAEIRGHRRTYVGALPGALVQALKSTGTNNPVILLDEIDKLGMSSTHGDPGAALLEVLDPEQNWCFKDHYLDIPLDLSSVLFIATANSLETISEPLYDRMETIELSGYVHDEKLHIAKRYLLPKQLKANSLPPDLLVLPDEVLLQLVSSYTHEAGVRSLEREIGAVCRAKAVEYTEALDRAKDRSATAGQTDVEQFGYKKRVDMEDLERILGVPKYDREELDRENLVGVSTGLAYQGSGNGGVLFIESSTMPGHGSFELTGQLGDVISESAHLAFAWVKSHAYELGISTSKSEDVFKNIDIHLHLPSGSIKKDGPSAGVAMVVAMVSLMRGLRQRKGVAMTGEITLRGNVSPVGGIKEKVLGAHRAGIHTLILPHKNSKDVGADLPEAIRKECTFVYVRTIWEALEAAFGHEALWDGVKERGMPVVESRL